MTVGTRLVGTVPVFATSAPTVVCVANGDATPTRPDVFTPTSSLAAPAPAADVHEAKHEAAHSNALAVSTSLLPGAVGAALQAVPPPQRFSRLVAQCDGKSYQQTVPKWVDAEGDAQLIRRMDRVPTSLAKRMARRVIGKKPAPTPALQIGSQNPIKAEALYNRFVQIVRDHYPDIRPTLGEEHKWSPQANRYLHYGFWDRMGRAMCGKQLPPAPLLHRTKLFLMLAVGLTSRYAVTGQEAALEGRLMTYPDRAARLEDVLRESYVLNKGNLYNTLMTAENVLARDVKDPKRAEQPVQKKLQYIRNDSTPHGDNYGSWYHFMGMSLYAMMRPSWMSHSVAHIEAAGSYVLGGPDPQEDAYNVAGAKFGSRLRQMVDKETWRQALPATADTQYMNLTQFTRHP